MPSYCRDWPGEAAPADHSVLLVIDPGKSSGFAVGISGMVRISGQCDNAIDRHVVCAAAIESAHTLGSKLRVVYETPAGGKLTRSSLVGIGKTIGRWLESIELAARDYPKTFFPSTVEKLHPSTWKHSMLPRVRGQRGWTRAQLEKLLPQWAASQVPGSDELVVGMDEAAALAMFWHVVKSDVH